MNTLVTINRFVDGMTIPKDTTVAIFLYGMAHDPAVFPDPEKFDPDRFLPEKINQRHNFAYVPFSAGPRNCVGKYDRTKPIFY